MQLIPTFWLECWLTIRKQEQCRLARELMTENVDAWICRIVLVETVWVLQSAYQFNKEQILLIFEKLIQHPNFHLEDATNLYSVLTIFSAGNAGFADCLILNDAQHNQLILHTFDLKLSRLHGAKRVEKGS